MGARATYGEHVLGRNNLIGRNPSHFLSSTCGKWGISKLKVIEMGVEGWLGRGSSYRLIDGFDGRARDKEAGVNGIECGEGHPARAEGVEVSLRMDGWI